MSRLCRVTSSSTTLSPFLPSITTSDPSFSRWLFFRSVQALDRVEPAEVDPVVHAAGGVEILDRVDVPAGPEHELVDPVPALERVVALAAHEDITGVAAEQLVAAGAAVQPVLALAAGKIIVARTTQQGVIAAIAGDIVIPAVGVDIIVVPVADDYVVSLHVPAVENRPVPDVIPVDHVPAIGIVEIQHRLDGAVGNQNAHHLVGRRIRVIPIDEPVGEIRIRSVDRHILAVVAPSNS
ncbi:MAG: hypothetical protein R3D80_13495 [Paracoccaceae bacterium]